MTDPSTWRIEQKTEGEENRDRGWRELINDYIHMYSMLPAPLLSHCCLRSQNPDYHSGGHPDPSHSVLLPSEPIKRPSQHSVAIQTTPTLFAFRRGKGSTGGGGERATRTAPTPPKWQKNDLVSGGHGQPGSWRGQLIGWIGSAPEQISGCGLDGALS